MERNYQIDLLRVVACIMVIVMHVVPDVKYSTVPLSFEFKVLSFYDCACRAAVPVFFMITGAFNNSANINKAIKKAFFFFVLYIVFDTGYAFLDTLYNYRDGLIETSLLETFKDKFIHYKFHLWYLPAYISVVLAMPIINAAKRNCLEIEKYMCGLFLVFTVFKSTINDFFANSTVFFPQILNTFNFYTISDYLGYAVLGGILITHSFNKMQKAVIHLTSLIGFIVLYVLTQRASQVKGWYDETFFDRTNIFLFVIAVSLFVFFKDLKLSKWSINITKLISPYTIYIYLIHVFFTELLTRKGWYSISVNPIVGIPIKTLFCLICSFSVAYIVRSIWCRIIKVKLVQ